MSTDATPDAVEPTASVASDLSRRRFVASATVVAASGLSLAQTPARAAATQVDMAGLPPYGNELLLAFLRDPAHGQR
jgi:hypothetical protein